VSNNHTDVCIRCGYDEFSTSDDYVDQDYLNSQNKLVILSLLDKIRQIKYETKAFDKMWERVWDTEKDLDFEMDYQKDFTHILSSLED
jgi:capsule polysaccharide export protein KpsE/RkpR